MNRLLMISAFLFASVSITALAQQEPTQVGATFSKVYVPVGFDSNDNVQIVGEGMFKNACYRPAQTEVKIDNATKTINLGPVAYEYKGFCLQVILPFERTVDVGILKAGTWKITQGADAKVVAELPVKPALVLSADDYLYAPVSQAFLLQTNGRNLVSVTGQFPNSCFSLQKLEVSSSADTIVVQPIADLATPADKTQCKDGAFPFSKSVEVTGLKAGRYLLHVRSLNGNAVNQLVNVQ